MQSKMKATYNIQFLILFSALFKCLILVSILSVFLMNKEVYIHCDKLSRKEKDDLRTSNGSFNVKVATYRSAEFHHNNTGYWQCSTNTFLYAQIQQLM